MADLLNFRRHVRHFKETEVSKQAIDQLLAAAMAAPNGGTDQPWHFYVVSDVKLKQQLSLDAFDRKFIAKSPVLFVVCVEFGLLDKRFGMREEAEKRNLIKEAVAAVENLLFKAAQLGLGGCRCDAFSEKDVSVTLSLPGGRRPIAIVPIGEPRAEWSPVSTRSLDEITTYL